MPGERTLVRMLAAWRAVLVKIRKKVELRKPIRMVLIHHMNLHLAKMPAELHLVCRGQVLVSEQQKLIIEENFANSRVQIVVDGPGEIDTGELSAECRAEGPDLEIFVCHRVALGFE